MKREELAKPAFFLALCCGAFTVVVFLFFAALSLEIQRTQTQLHPVPSEGKLTLEEIGVWVVSQELDPDEPEGTVWLSKPEELRFQAWDPEGNSVDILPIVAGAPYDDSSEERKSLYTFEWPHSGTGRYSFELPEREDSNLTVGFTHGRRWTARDTTVMSLLPVLVPALMTLFFLLAGRFYSNSSRG